jgi:hypothetical protein
VVGVGKKAVGEISLNRRTPVETAPTPKVQERMWVLTAVPCSIGSATEGSGVRVKMGVKFGGRQARECERERSVLLVYKMLNETLLCIFMNI